MNGVVEMSILISSSNIIMTSISFKVGVFDVDSDDPLMLSNIVGEAVVSCWAMEKILPRKTKSIMSTNLSHPSVFYTSKLWHMRTSSLWLEKIYFHAQGGI